MPVINSIRRALLSLLFIAFALVQVNARTYIVAVGIGDYPGGKSDLRLPVSDVKALINLYKVYGGVSYELITDNKAKRSTVIASMNRTFAKAQKDDIVLFIFSGHGYPGGFIAYDEKMPYSDILTAMSKSESRHKMIFADACYSGKIRKNSGKKSNTGESDVMFFLSSRDNEKSIEMRFLNNGLFTTALLDGLKGYADSDKNKIITADELFKYVSSEVIRMSKGEQHPVMWGNFRNDMPVLDWK